MAVNTQAPAAGSTTQTYLEQGNAAMRAGHYSQALALFEQALKQSPALAKVIEFNIQLANLKLGKAVPVKPEILSIQAEKPPAKSENPAVQSVSASPAQLYSINSESCTVDIVVPVYNALDDVQRCLEAIERNTDDFKVNVYVINDGSETPTTEWLRAFCKNKPMFFLTENDKNKGYTPTVNVGLRQCKGDYIVTLNSDTIVTKGWLSGLVRCLSSDKKLGIVGPLSNAASWQSVPRLRDENGGFFINSVPDGFTIDGFAELVSQVSARIYPELPFVNGFCFMLKKEVLDSVGFMDEETFPVGYGEENDFCIRAIDAGYKFAIADDVYVFHAKSKSFGHLNRQHLSKQGSDNLKKKHGVEKYTGLVERVKNTAQLDDVRSRLQVEIEKCSKVGKPLALTDLSVLFLLPVKGGGGGSHSVVQEVTAMRRLGVNAKVAVNDSNLERFRNNYADIPNVDDIFIGFNDQSVNVISSGFDVVVATIFKSVKYLKGIVQANKHILPAYYIQDYEPMFFEKGSALWQEAYESYNYLPGIFCFAKTRWIIDQVKVNHAVHVEKVVPSIDHDVYKPITKKASSEMVITAMIRPQTPYRGAERTMLLLSRIKREFGNAVKVKIFGCESDTEEFKKLSSEFEFENAGVLTRPAVAALLAEADIFIDLSDYQAFGRTALEAMACETVSFVTQNGGTDEYAINGHNSFLVDPYDVDTCFDLIKRLIADPSDIQKIKYEGLSTAANYSPHKAAVSELVLMAKALAKHRELNPKKIKPKLALLPSLRGDSLPAGSGYVRVVMPYTHANVRANFDVDVVVDLPNPNDYDIFLIQRDASKFKLEDIKEWTTKVKSASKKIIYEIDDDLLDKGGMLQRGFKGNFDELASKVEFLAKVADKITVSTAKLKTKFEHYNSSVVVVPNMLDENLWQLGVQRDLYSGDYARSLDFPVKIGYIGTNTHQEDLLMISDAMNKLKEKYGDKIEIEVIGAFQNHKPLFGNRVALPKNTDYPSFVNWLLKRVKWDIGLIPLVNDNFNKSKSNLKFLEYAALDMAIIVSEHDVYKDIANKCNSNIVLNQNDSWFGSLSRLIDDESYRKKIAKEARSLVEDKYTLKNSSILELLRSLNV
ncbi:glycosyltransferase [Zobellella sp. An-6]|uniref:glycosyltransferase n=1 Tax=Zobellella sp. An-6 TaxID=3400218 RepID=UPI00404331D2